MGRPDVWGLHPCGLIKIIIVRGSPVNMFTSRVISTGGLLYVNLILDYRLDSIALLTIGIYSRRWVGGLI